MDYTDVARAFLGLGMKGLMVVYDNHEATGVRNNVGLGVKSLVIKYSKETDNCDCVEAGVLILRRDALDYLEVGVPSSLEEGLYPALIKQRELAAYLTRQRFYDIGTPRQLRVFEEYVQRGNQ
jgi:NDP-sugar pyrophosphorylase family protein